MNPQIIIVLDEKGIKTTRIVANTLEEQAKVEALYKKILHALEILNRTISGEDKESSQGVDKETGEWGV